MRMVDVMKTALTISVLLLAPATWALAQSSSLYLASEAQKAKQAAATTQPAANGSLRADAGATAPQQAGRNTAVIQSSLTSVSVPEPKVMQVNDLVGVIVRYRLRHESDSKLKQESKWDANAELAAWFRIHDRKLQQQQFRGGTPEVDFKADNKLDNKGKSDRNDVFETRLQSKVIDIKPNGNLIIVAWSHMQIDDENQYLRLTGECRKDDIAPDNTVTSDKVFALDVQTMNEGSVRDAIKRGWFKELMDDVKPF